METETLSVLLKTIVAAFKAFDLRIKSLEATVEELSDSMEDMENEIRKNRT